MADVQGQQHHFSSPPTPSPPVRDSWYPYSNNGGSHFNGGIAMVLIFIFSAVVCALAINTAIRFFLRSAQPPPAGPLEDGKATNSTDPSVLSLPTLIFSLEDKTRLPGGGECAICLSEFVEGEGVRILPKCKHGFHVKCIEGWLASHVSCPTCRTACKDDNGDNYDVEAPPLGLPPPPPPPAPPAVVSEVPTN